MKDIRVMKNEILESLYDEIQQNLVKKIELYDKIMPEKIQFISGVDLAYWQDHGLDYAICCVVTINYISKEVVEIYSTFDSIDVDYTPGYLSFRELPLILKTFKLLRSKTDIIIFDGNGYLHYRNMGIATHASFYLNKPTIGVAKSYLKIDNIDYLMPEDKEGSFTDIIISGKIYGRAVRTHKGIKPIFVSCGNWITLDTATNIVLSLVNDHSRQPIPTRLADIESKRQRKIIRGF